MRELLIPNASLELVAKAIENDCRVDGRRLRDFRSLQISVPRANEAINGRAEVLLGSTRVLAVVSCEIVEPQPERPTEGFFLFNVDVSPMADASVELGRPSQTAIAVARVVEQSLRDSDSVDTESLCIIAGKKVWQVRCDVRVLDDGGNALDCVSIAAAAALLHARRPDLTVDGHRVIVHSADERAPVPLSIHHVPICVSFDFFSDASDGFVCDATLEERAASAGSITMALNAHGELCVARKSGGLALRPDALIALTLIAKRRVLDVTSAIRGALKRAGLTPPRALAIVGDNDDSTRYASEKEVSSSSVKRESTVTATTEVSIETSARVIGGVRAVQAHTSHALVVTDIDVQMSGNNDHDDSDNDDVDDRAEAVRFDTKK
jgi:exosome complex component RRP45